MIRVSSCPAYWRTICHNKRCIHKFPDWPPGARTTSGKLSDTRFSCIAIFWASLSEFHHQILYVASQRVFIFCCLFRYELSPETFGYIRVFHG